MICKKVSEDFKHFLLFGLTTLAAACANVTPISTPASQWVLISDFESDRALSDWSMIDAQNETVPFVAHPQIAELQTWPSTGDRFLMRKPAADGIVGNRRAIAFTTLPFAMETGQNYTVFTRINVEAFPNNHSFGLSNLQANEIADAHYDAFEPMVRITDKPESNGDKNDGTLMVLSGNKTYRKIRNRKTGSVAKPLNPGAWYDLWMVIKNGPRDEGGQRYDLYVLGGEFSDQTLVFENADFRIQREAALLHFMTICNTGPLQHPYGNGGVRYDDLYAAKGVVLSHPKQTRLEFIYESTTMVSQ